MIFGVSFFCGQEDDDDLQKRKDHDEGLHSLMTTFTKDYDIEFNNEFLDKQDYNPTALTKLQTAYHV